jgi:simple sugar transport system permease protein/ribose transport system permease protein
MIVLGLGLTIMVGKLDLSLESTLVFAPGLATVVMTKWIVGGINPILLIILILLLGGLVGYINGIFITIIQVDDFLQTLSMMIILRGLALFILPFSIYPLTDIVGRAFTFPGGGRMFWDIPVAIPIVIVIFLVFHFLLHYTPYGRRVMSTGGNARASFVSGIDIKRSKL